MFKAVLVLCALAGPQVGECTTQEQPYETKELCNFAVSYFDTLIQTKRNNGEEIEFEYTLKCVKAEEHAQQTQ